MTLRIFKILVIVFIVALSFGLSLDSAFAQEGLVPCETDKNPEDCNECHVVQLIQNVTRFIFTYLVPAVSLVLFVIAGFLIMTGTPGAITQGRSILKTTVIGIVLMLTAFMITTFILKTVAGDKDYSETWHTVDCTGLTSSGGGGPTRTASPTTSPSTSSGPSTAFANKIAPETQEFFDCLRENFPDGVGRLTSTTDNNIARGTCDPLDPNERFNSAGNCQHRRHSCHYGGTSATCHAKGTYALDFGDEENDDAIRTAALACNPGAFVLNEGTHMHVSIGRVNGCGCD